MLAYAAVVTDLSPRARTVALPAGLYRLLEWPAEGADEGRLPEGTVVLLHGLSGVAEVWADVVAALEPPHPAVVALDQRGHGHSPRTPGRYAATDYLADLVALVDQFDGPVHLVGHSMGGRVATLAAARHEGRFASVVIVDIGPEAWKANIDTTTKLFAAMPPSFPNRDAALEVGRLAKRGEEWASRFVDWRLRARADGTYTWLGSTEALTETVQVQRATNYWADWDAIATPALLVRGSMSKELRPWVAEKMQHRNPAVAYVEIPEVGHNIPMDAPEALAAALTGFWGRDDGGPTTSTAPRR